MFDSAVLCNSGECRFGEILLFRLEKKWLLIGVTEGKVSVVSDGRRKGLGVGRVNRVDKTCKPL